jgi:hypothetical protein
MQSIVIAEFKQRSQAFTNQDGVEEFQVAPNWTLRTEQFILAGLLLAEFLPAGVAQESGKGAIK